MQSPWYSLMTNVAITAFVITSWTQIRDVFDRFGPRTIEVFFGLFMGVGAVTAMLFPVQFSPGVIFDFRTCLVAIAAFFGGPLAGTIAAIMAGAYRIWLGGVGAPVAILTLAIVVTAGGAGRLYLRRHGLPIQRWHSIPLAAATSVAGLTALLILPIDLAGSWPIHTALRTLLLFAAVLLAGLALTREEELRTARRENQTYRQIIDALPDSISVRNLDDRFIAANPATAHLLGVDSTADLIGRPRNEFPPATPQRDPEEGVEYQQVLDRPDGTRAWLQTLKVDLRDDQDMVVGTITHNRDITARKQLELELEERQQVINFAMAQMSDGVAMYDHDGRLLYCNAQYQQLFPRTSDVRVPGAHIRTILSAAAARHEQQVGAPPLEIARWIDRVAESLNRDAEEEVHLFNGTWLRVSTRPSPDGMSMVVVSDITSLKRTELELLNVTEQLRQEATTDALTGLVNRRALDQRLDIEIARSLRTEAPISAIWLDIDYFKAYNDTYGHPAGDECLKTVARCLGEVFQRPADLIARYGGEEFLVILPETHADAAYLLANEYRGVLKGMALTHRASPFGHVTVSLGVAGYAHGETERSAAELVSRADEAMYAAKAAGRDRTVGWRRHFPLVPRKFSIVG